MFIRRKNTVKSKGSIKTNRSLPPVQQKILHKDIEIYNYPALQLLISLIFFALSIYFLYSVSGGANSIQGFNNRIWWQFILALIPGFFGLGFMVSCQTQLVIFSRKQNRIQIKRRYFFCIQRQTIEKQFTDFVGLSIVKRGTQTINYTSTSYFIVLSFKTFEEVEVLECKSEMKILEHFQEIRNIFDSDEISQKKVIIKNMINES